MIGPVKPTDYQTQVKIFESAGCIYVRTHGDHMIYHFPGAQRPVVIPMYREVPVFIIRNNMKTIGLTVEEYRKIIEEFEDCYSLNTRYYDLLYRDKDYTAEAGMDLSQARIIPLRQEQKKPKAERFQSRMWKT